MEQKLAVIILAAGKGTRMKSDIPKVMHRIAGRPMIGWLLETVEKLSPEKIAVVLAPGMDDVRDAVHPHDVAIQTEQRGTADAAKAALPALSGFEGKILVLMGDEPLVSFESLQAMVKSDSPLAVQGFRAENPLGYGRIVTGAAGELRRIVEEKDCAPAERSITLCNGGNYCIESDLLPSLLERITNGNAQGEFYLTDIVTLSIEAGRQPVVCETRVPHVWGVNSRAQLAEHELAAQEMLRRKAMAGGATLQAPESVYFSWDTKLGRDVEIEPHVVFGPGVTVGDRVTVHAFSHLEGATLEGGVSVGPFARLRPGAVLEENAKIGNFVEVKKARIGKGAKANHLAYIGDARIGAGSNIGAGTITCNYDGFDKHTTDIGAGAFIGSNSTLVAPITIGEGAYVAAGSTLTHDVPENALAVARNRPMIRDGWAAGYRTRKSAKKKTASP